MILSSITTPQYAEIKIGLLSASDRATAGVYADAGIPALREWLQSALHNPISFVEKLVADDQATIEAALLQLVDVEACSLVITTGGTGPAPRDVTPDATLAVAQRVMDGFGERMRQISRCFVPTAILSRQVAVTRGKCLIINLPGQPKAIAQTLGGFKAAAALGVGSGSQDEVGIFTAVPYCIDLLGGPYIETKAEVIVAFRPKSAAKSS